MGTEKVDQKRRKEINLEHSIGGYGTGDQESIEYVIYCTEPLAERFEEYHIHSSQVITKIKNNNYRIKFKLGDSLEIIRILSQYGEFINKIEPESVYDQVKEIWRKGLEAA